jgi:UDPglucose 6-dehydrogenase
MTPWADYRALDPAALAKTMRGRIVLDPWDALDAGKCNAAGLIRHILGVSS